MERCFLCEDALNFADAGKTTTFYSKNLLPPDVGLLTANGTYAVFWAFCQYITIRFNVRQEALSLYKSPSALAFAKQTVS